MMRRTMPRGITVLAALLTALAVVATPATAADDTSAQAINTEDGSSLFSLAFDIRRVADGVVDQTNTAVAYASCEECTTIAVSIQVVLVTGGADVVEPENTAVAVNEECTSCDTLASAYQFVVGGDGPVRFTGEGSRRIAELRRRLRAIERDGLSVEEAEAEVEAIVAELRDVLDTQLVAAGPPPGVRERGETASPEPSASGGSEAAPSPGASGTPSPTASGTSDPGPSASPTASGGASATSAPTRPAASPSADEDDDDEGDSGDDEDDSGSTPRPSAPAEGDDEADDTTEGEQGDGGAAESEG